MADYFVSSAATNGYVVGNDSNTGLTKDDVPPGSGPFLTLDPLTGVGGSNTATVNGTEVNLTASVQGGAGGSLDIIAEVQGATTIRATAGVTRLINAAGSSGSVSVDGFLLHTDNVSGGLVYGQSGTNACTVTVDNCEVVGTSPIPNEGVVYASTATGGAPTLNVNNLTISVDIGRSVVQAADGQVNIAVNGVVFNNVNCAASGNTLFGNTNADAGGSASVSNLSGEVTMTAASGSIGFVRFFDIDGMIIENNNLTVNVNNAALVLDLFRGSVKAESCDNGFIRNNVVNFNAEAGYCALFGEDSATESLLNINNNQITGNTFNNMTSGTSTIHCTMAGRASGTTISNNTVSGGLHGVIYKQATTGIADNNTISEIVPSGNALRAKGATDVTFSNSLYTATAGWEAALERADDNGATSCSNVLFLNNDLQIQPSADYTGNVYTQQAVGYTISEARWDGSNYYDVDGPLGAFFNSDTGLVDFDGWAAKAYVSNVTNQPLGESRNMKDFKQMMQNNRIATGPNYKSRTGGASAGGGGKHSSPLIKTKP